MSKLRGKFFDGDQYVIVESDHNRVSAGGDDLTFQQVNLYHRPNIEADWREVVVWDCAEWQDGDWSQGVKNAPA